MNFFVHVFSWFLMTHSLLAVWFTVANSILLLGGSGLICFLQTIISTIVIISYLGRYSHTMKLIMHGSTSIVSGLC